MLDQTSSRAISHPSRIGIFTLLLASPFASACGSAMGDDTGSKDAVGASREAIINGSDATMLDDGALVKVSSSGTCSGALLSDSWVLTARHCIPGAQLSNPPSIPTATVTIKNLNGVSRTVAQAFYMPGEYIADEHGDAETVETDVALLRLSTPFPLDFKDAFSTAINYLYPYANRGLEGGYLRCAGFGWRELNGSSGKASFAFIDVDYTFPDEIVLVPDEDGQIDAPGDSGGPCTARVSTASPFQARVGSGGAVERNEAGEIAITNSRGAGAQSFRDWALGIMNFGVGLYSDKNFKGNAETVANSTLALSRVGDAAISSVRVPPGWQAKLWDTPVPGFGSSITVTGNVSSMPTGWDDRVLSVEVLQNGVQIFRDASFAGSTRTLAPGRFDAADLGTLFNNNISSLRIPSDWRVRAFLASGFVGGEIQLYGSAIGNLGATVNDAISSLVVEQPVTVFSDDLYFGEYQIFWEGPYNYSDMMVPDKSISSIVVPAGFTVEAFEDENQTGASITFSSSQPWMPEGWNERISSLRVRRAR